jgi:hypothetical protein
MNVKRFVLFVSCDLSSVHLQKEITNQEERFAAFNVEYEAWSAAKIANKLRSQLGIVSTGPTAMTGALEPATTTLTSR